MPVLIRKPDGTDVAFHPIGTNAICALEESLGITFGEILAAIGVTGMETWSLRITREFLKACAVEPITVEAVGDLIDVVGFEPVGAAVNQLIVPAQVANG